MQLGQGYGLGIMFRGNRSVLSESKIQTLINAHDIHSAFGRYDLLMIFAMRYLCGSADFESLSSIAFIQIKLLEFK